MNNFFARLTGWYFKKEALPYWCVLAIDCLIILFFGFFVHYLFVGGGGFTHTFWPYTWGLLVTVACYVVFFRVFSTYSGIIRYSSFVDLQRVAMADLSGAALGVLVSFICTKYIPTYKLLLPDVLEQLLMVFFVILMMWGERIVVKLLYETVRRSGNNDRAFIYGIKDGGVALAKNIRSQDPMKYDIRGFIAPDNYEGKMPKLLMGSPVYKDDNDLLDIIHKNHICAIIVSPLQNEHFREREGLIDALIRSNVRIMMYPASIEEWDGKSDLHHEQLHEVDIEDLLPREKIEVDLDAIGRLLHDQVVMVTGAAGSIGYEMARQVAKFAPKNLILIDQAETPMHTVRLHMANHYPGLRCETIVSSITNQTKMESVFAQYRPAYVFHAAAYKHVPMMEDNPSEAVQNNIYGTRIIADLAVKYGTQKFVMISTDKAVNPTNVMGCSKRICEIYCQSLNKAIQDGTCPIKYVDANGIEGPLPVGESGERGCQFITTRFGNVLGSNGSVIPIFKKQIAAGGPITVTHPDIIRFFMLIPEACRLVLEAGTMGHGGEIFVFDMGKPVRIADLAQRMIDLSGAKNIEIKFTGLRDGEKLYEEVLNDAEQTKPTVHPKIMVAQVREYDYELAARNEEELLRLSYTYDDMAIVRKMKEIVPEYRSQHSKYEVLDKTPSFRLNTELTMKETCGLKVITLPRKKGEKQGTMVQFNDTSAYLYNAMRTRDAFSVDDMVTALLEEYDTDEATVRPWCEDLLIKWREAGLMM